MSHKEELKEIKKVEKMIKKDHVFLGIIAFLLLIVAVLLGFMLGKMGSTTGGYEKLTLTVITDSRNTDGLADGVLSQIETLPSIQAAKVVKKDFSDSGVEKMLKDNNITTLPAFIFSTNNFDTSLDPQTPGQNGQVAPKINVYLSPLPKDGFSLPVGSNFNPFQERSANGNLMIDSQKVNELLENVYFDGNKNASIVWLEYSDMECPFCAKLHNDGTPKAIMDSYGSDLAIVFQHFPLNFHPQAQKAAEALECIGEQSGDAVYYNVIEEGFKKYNNNNFSLDGFYDLAADQGVNKDTLTQCVDSGKYAQKVKDQMDTGAQLFGITGTPGNVLMNKNTGEYVVVSGAAGAPAFEQAIERIK